MCNGKFLREEDKHVSLKGLLGVCNSTQRSFNQEWLLRNAQ